MSETQPLLWVGDVDPADDAMPTLSSPASFSLYRKAPISQKLLLVVMLGLVCLGSCNFVTLKIMYASYGEKYAYFVSQGVNLLYLIFGGIVVLPLLCTGRISKEERNTPGLWRKFVVMGLLDCGGTFLCAMGNVYTPGQYQPVLNQTLIPLTMMASFMWMGRRFKAVECAGALLILGGACLSVLPGLLKKHDESTVRWYSVLLYFGSNIPMAASAIYKELSFQDTVIHVYYLTQWVSLWQLLFGFLFMPLLTIPGFGSAGGASMVELWADFTDGTRCYLHIDPECAEKGAFWLLTGYTCLNFLFNTLGLFLTKHGSAVLNGMSYAILLPMTTVAFSLPVLGPYREELTPFTFGGLACVLVGFLIYQHFSDTVGSGGAEAITDLDQEARGSRLSRAPSVDSIDARMCDGSPRRQLLRGRTKSLDTRPFVPRVRQASFQERVVGMGLAWNRIVSVNADRGKS